MHKVRNTSAVILSVAIMSLAGVSAASAHLSNDGCVPPGLFEPEGLVEPVSEPEAETPETDADLGLTV